MRLAGLASGKNQNVKFSWQAGRLAHCLLFLPIEVYRDRLPYSVLFSPQYGSEYIEAIRAIAPTVLSRSLTHSGSTNENANVGASR
jgi:hypothetical protein